MIGGGAYAAGKHVQRGQQREEEQSEQIAELQESQPGAQPRYAEAAPAPAVDPVTALTQLKSLLDGGALTQAEFDDQKQRILQES
jgi:membrane protease subunit (stomatin/prohibitin family)